MLGNVSFQAFDFCILTANCSIVHALHWYNIPRGREPMDREPEVALSMNAFGSPANREILPDISSKSTASRAMLSTFATNHAALSHIRHVLLLKYYMYYW